MIPIDLLETVCWTAIVIVMGAWILVGVHTLMTYLNYTPWLCQGL